MGASAVLLISEATVLAVVALAAIVVVALVVLALVVLRPHAPAAPQAAPAPAQVPVPAPHHVGRVSAARPVAGGRSVEIDVPTPHVDEFMNALRASGWRVHETGEVVATDDDEEGLTTVLVDLPKTSQRTATGEEIR